MIRAEVRFMGRVQGVGFRATAQRLAMRCSLTGWVRNDADGSVFLVAEGNPVDVNAFLESLQVDLARFIRSTQRHDAEARGEIGFEIRR